MLARSRTKFGMTPAEPTAERHPQSDTSGNLTKEVLVPSDCTTKEVSVKAEKYLSLRADECRRGNPVKNAVPSCHSELVSESVPRYEQVSNISQTLNPSCSTREKRHREKRGFRLVPLLLAQFRVTKICNVTVRTNCHHEERTK